MQGLLGGMQRFAQGVNGLLYPGFNAAGVDPETAKRAQAQAMMQMGMGLLGGAPAGQAYAGGMQAGFEPIEQSRREAMMRAAAQDRQAMADERERRQKADEGAAARQAQIEAELRPLIDAGDYEGASRVYARYMMPQEAKAVRDLGAKPGLTIESASGPHGGTILSGNGRWQYVPPQRGQAAAPSNASATQPQPKPSKPIPTSALRIVDEANQAIAAASQSKAIVDNAIATLQSGGVQLGAVRNMESRARNFAGASDENSRAYADIQQTLEKLRNNYLLLAKGVQTEGDAQRAWNSEIGENVQNDNALALQQLQKAQGMIDMALQAQQGRVETVYGNFGSEPPAAAPKAGPGGPVPGVTKEGGYIYIGGDPGKRESWVKER